MLIRCAREQRPRSVGLTTVEAGEGIVRQIELRKMEFRAQKVRVTRSNRCAASATPHAVD